MYEFTMHRGVVSMYAEVGHVQVAVIPQQVTPRVAVALPEVA